jgi:hypothetical protein
MKCQSAELEQRLSELPPGAAPSDAALVAHLKECTSCAAAIEQRARWFGAWDRSEPSAAAIARLRLKLGSVPPTRWRSPRSVFAYAVAALSVTGLAGASGYLLQEWRSTPPAPLASDTENHAPLVERAERPHKAAPAPVASVPVTPEPAVPESAADERAPERGARPSHTAPRPPASGSARTAEHWSEAATALRQGDSARADKALSELANSRDAATRDAASLALAELWISQGKTAKARPTLETLAKRGATPLIRSRARELLAH